MEEPVATPKLPPPIFKSFTNATNIEQQFSSSPGFGTPAYPIIPRTATIRQPFAAQLNVATTSNAPTVLPILLPPQTLRPVAFRTLTKKHNLTLTSSSLGLLATFVGKFCGSGWREEGLAERILDEIAKAWKRNGGGVIIEDGPERKLSGIIKSLEPCMSAGRLDSGRLSRTSSTLSHNALSRQSSLDTRPNVDREDSQTSLGMSGLVVEDDADTEMDGQDQPTQDSRAYLKIISTFDQPRFTYSTTKKTMDRIPSTPSLLPPIQQKTSMFRNRYHMVHQRLMRNEAFQTPTFSSGNKHATLLRSGSSAVTAQHAYKITPISNLLGRSGSNHLLLGMLTTSSAGDLALADLSGSVVLDMSVARPVPEDGAWFCPGMMVLVEGMYEEDGTNNSNLAGAGGVGGQIKGRLHADTIAGPPAEKRDITLGTVNGVQTETSHTSVGAGYGWVDFLGVGSEKAVENQMKRLQKRILQRPSETNDESPRTKLIVMAECHLDNPRTLEAIKSVLNYYNSSGEVGAMPLSIVFMGNFVSCASMAGSGKGGGSVEYKELFDGLASVLSEFSTMLANTTLVFVPGDNDPWASSFSGGASVTIPRQGVPELFTSRIRRAINNANNEIGRKDNRPTPGEAIWTSNPARISLFGPVEEIVLFRDDISGRLRRNSLSFSTRHQQQPEEPHGQDVAMTPPNPETTQTTEPTNIDTEIQTATSHLPDTNLSLPNPTTLSARKITKTILDQAHLSPFPLSLRPVLWDYCSGLHLHPLPSALVLADAEMPSFSVTYEGCHVMNPGRVLEEVGSRSAKVARWIEYDFGVRKGVAREIRL